MELSRSSEPREMCVHVSVCVLGSYQAVDQGSSLFSPAYCGI